MKQHYVYRITRPSTGEWYVGMSYSRDPIDDGYMGSGRRITDSLAKHGRGEFLKQVLAIVDSREEASRLEGLLVSENSLKDPLCLNLQVGGYGAPVGNQHRKGKKLSPSHIEALRQANLGNSHATGHRRNFTLQHVENMSRAAQGNTNQAKKQTAEHRAAISAGQKARWGRRKLC